ncbi:hypothetical protein [Cupriavidus sp. CP313]
MKENWIVEGMDGNAWLLFDENSETEAGAPYVKVYGSKEAADDVAARLNKGQPQ